MTDSSESWRFCLHSLSFLGGEVGAAGAGEGRWQTQIPKESLKRKFPSPVLIILHFWRFSLGFSLQSTAIIDVSAAELGPISFWKASPLACSLFCPQDLATALPGGWA